MFQCVVGLGNPGPEYLMTRHNIGFLLVDALAAAYGKGADGWQKKHHGLWQKITVESHNLFLLKPQTFMNRSGLAVAGFAGFYKFPLAEFLVIHDELDLPLGKLRLKQGGGDGGHNGLRSIDSQLGKEYWRLRLGISRPAPERDVSNYVLGRFSAAEQEVLADWLGCMLEEFPVLLAHGPDRFMTRMATCFSPPGEQS